MTSFTGGRRGAIMASMLVRLRAALTVLILLGAPALVLPPPVHQGNGSNVCGICWDDPVIDPS